MLPKSKRLDRKTVEKIFSTGRFIKSNNLSLKFFIDLKNKNIPRISFIVPKSVSKMAVERNNLRRKGYTSLDKLNPEFPAGFIGAFIFNRKVFDISDEIKNIIHKIH